MSDLASLLAERIVAEGPITFAEFQRVALYHPEHGYYSAGPQRSGWRGHFLTAAELDPAFGALWAGAFAAFWEAAGRPEGFEVIEIGGGEGGFASAVLDAAPPGLDGALTYRLVEPLAPLAKRQRERLAGDERVIWCTGIDDVDAVEAGCVFANEVLDNQPVHVLEKRGDELVEIYVTTGRERLDLVAGPVSTDAATLVATTGPLCADGGRTEVSPDAARLVERAAGLIGRGAVVWVDYGLTSAQRAERPAGTVLAYSSGGIEDSVLEAPGSKDITSHADWSATRLILERAGYEVVGPRSQRDVLRALGIDSLHERLRAEHGNAVAEHRGADALRSLSRRQALGALADPGGLGGLQVVIGCRGIAPPAFIA